MYLTLPGTWILNRRGRPRDDLAMSKKAVSSGRSMGYVSPIPTRAPRIPPEYTVVSSHVAPCGTGGSIVIAPCDGVVYTSSYRKFKWTYGKKFLWWGLDRTKIRVHHKDGSAFMLLSDSFEILAYEHQGYDFQIAQMACIQKHLKKELFNVELERMLL